ncbi:MAG TPA: hypothetical protein VGO00_30610, partial [Kofleriaceae bacterium]|nr:hypothetical protein [Kofleriaceae bacterium]
MRRHLARYGEWWWVPILYTLAVIWIYRDQWHVHGQPTGFGWDAIDSYGPDLQYQSDDLARGQFSLWNPYDKGGYPLVGDPQYDRYYPFNWIFVVWGAVFGSSWWLIQIKIVAHHIVAAATMHLFLRSRGLGVRAAIVGGFAIIACAPLLLHKASNILWPLVWVPLVWVAIDAALAKPSWRRGAALAAAFTLCVTAGSPPGLFYAGLLVGSYGAWRLAQTLIPPERRVRALVICLAVAGALIGLVVALTTVPAQAVVQLGSRFRWQPEDQFPLALSLPWAESMRGVIARGAGLGEMYMGAATCLVALCAVVVRPRFDGRIVILFAIVAAIALVLAGGENTPVLPWLVHHVPGFGLLRIPGRYKLVAAWSIAAAAGYGIGALDTAIGSSRVRAIACAGAVVAIVVAFVGLRPEHDASRELWWS